MKNIALWEHFLGLQSPWSVKSVDLSLVETLVFFRAILYLLLVIIVIAIVWQKECGDVAIKEDG